MRAKQGWTDWRPVERDLDRSVPRESVGAKEADVEIQVVQRTVPNVRGQATYGLALQYVA